MPGALDVPAGALNDPQSLLAMLQQLQSGQASPEAQRSARTQGLLQAALGVLGNSYVPYGHSGMEGIAQGLGQGLTGYQGEIDRQKALVADRFKYAGLASQLQKQITLQTALKSGDAKAIAAARADAEPVKYAEEQAKLYSLKPGEGLQTGAGVQVGMPMPFKSDAMSPELFGQKQQLAELTAQRERALAAYKAGLPTRETWTTPLGLTDENGNPVQVSSAGATRPLEGVKPAQKAVPPGVAQKLLDHGQLADTTERLATSFKPEYGGHTFLGDWSNYVGRLKGDTTGQVQWWADYQNHTNTVRNKLFGSALTPTEQAEWTKANVDPRMNSGEIQKNLDRRKDLEAIGLERAMKGSAVAGFNRKEIETLGGREIGSAPLIASRTLIPTSTQSTPKKPGFAHLWE